MRARRRSRSSSNAPRSRGPGSRTTARPADLAHVCAALDGLPLALELAAAQVRFFSVRELARRVARPEFAPTSLDSTLRATIELLDRDERRLFARLAVFEHPWTIAEAEAVCAGAELAEDVVLPAIARLVERSLVQTQTSDRVVRHRLLDTVRRVALKTGEDERAACREHAVDWYAGAMVRLGLDGIPDGSAMEQLAERHDGSVRCSTAGAPTTGLVLRAVASTRKYWEWRGLAAESLVRIDARAATAVDRTTRTWPSRSRAPSRRTRCPSVTTRAPSAASRRWNASPPATKRA